MRIPGRGGGEEEGDLQARTDERHSRTGRKETRDRDRPGSRVMGKTLEREQTEARYRSEPTGQREAKEKQVMEGG